MPGFSFSKAKELELLNSTEIERLAIMYLAAADEFKVRESQVCEWRIGC